MFIQTETTPNPATLKFLPGKIVLERGNAEFRSADDAIISPLATRLFAVPGVEGVMFGYDFVSVTRGDQEWQHLKPAILGAIMEHFMSGAPTMAGEASHEDLDTGEEFFDAGDETIVATIKELLETRVRPAVAQDGGDITFRGYREGTVFLNMKGACSGCPSSTATLKHGVQNLLHHFVPEVEHVEAV
ncbi:NifU family protein [Martelella alba]|uniref:NifU family protein n=1 Tax=Martelella alba TaxID=2590451 RepID=A0A506UAM3_9HYPH|nr:NifU family protein [Martelella alba]TPW30124.1 NifU family protein [Martelella alba]